MHRSSWQPALVLSGALIAVMALPAVAGPRVPVLVRDSWTGKGIPGASLRLSGNKAGAALLSDAQAHASLELPAKKDWLDVKAQGYRPLRVDMDPAATLPLTVWLDPEEIPSPAAAPKGETVLEGYVVDVQTGKPVPGAVVRAGGAEALTKKDGAFLLTLPAQALTDPQALPASSSVSVEAASYASLTVSPVMLEPGVARHMVLDLEPGQGPRTVDVPHRMLEAESGAPGTQEPWAEPPTPSSVVVPGVYAADGIKVGTSCSCTSCGGVSAMSLETYVSRGVDNEWISSWENPVGSAGRHAMRAGAVAYRSYGAWYVNNPLNASYHICSTTCCQAYDTTTSAQSRNAASFTQGVVLSKDGLSIFRSEYSSENNSLSGSGCVNNDLSCGAGKAGSPATGWSCISDHPNCTPRVCFGHGRGMCQYGSNFWANNSSKDYLWILDHYYNGNFNPSGSRSVYVEEVSAFDVALNADGRMDVFGRGAADNALMHASQASASSTTWVAFSGISSGLLLSSPAVAANSDGRLQVVLRGTSNAVWTAAQASPNGAWSGWTQLGSLSASSEPVLARNPDGRLQVFIRGTDYQLYTAAQTAAGGAFGAWTSLGGTCTTGPAVGVNQDGRLQLFVRGTDDQLYTRWQSTAGGSAWADWVSVGTAKIGSKVAVARNSNGTLEVFARGVEDPNPVLWRVRQTVASGVNSWGAWASTGDGISTAPAVFANSDGRLQVVTCGTAGDLRTAAQSSASGSLGAFTSLGGTCTSAPVMARNTDGRLQFFIRGLDRKLYSRIQGTAGGSFTATWYDLGGTL